MSSLNVMVKELVNDDIFSGHISLLTYCELFAKFINCISPETLFKVKLEIVNNRKTPDDVLVLLAQDTDYGVKKAVACSPRAPLAALKILSKDPQASIRKLVALNPNVTEELLKSLIFKNIGNLKVDELFEATNSHYWESELDVLIAVAKSKNSTEKILKYLSGCKAYQVRRAVAINANVTEDILWNLAKDSSCRVRKQVALNYCKTPKSILEYLVEHDSSHGVIQAAERALEDRFCA